LKSEKNFFDTEEIDIIKKEFYSLMKNQFEPEFEPSPENKFQKIVDENEKGPKQYANFLNENCL